MNAIAINNTIPKIVIAVENILYPFIILVENMGLEPIGGALQVLLVPLYIPRIVWQSQRVTIPLL